MQLSSAIRAALIALTVTGAGLTTVYADFGGIRFNVIKAGFVVGGSGGSGTLVFHGRRYPISIGGVSWGFTFGASATDFIGTVSNIRTPFDVWRIRRCRRGWPWRGRDRTGQPERRSAVGSPNGTDRRCRPQRTGDLAAVVRARA